MEKSYSDYIDNNSDNDTLKWVIGAIEAQVEELRLEIDNLKSQIAPEQNNE